MAIGDLFPCEAKPRADALTGAIVERLTDDTADTWHPYFTQNLLSADGDRLLVASRRSGRNQLYDLRVDEGMLVQLTEGAAVGAHGAVRHPWEPLVYYVDGQVLHEVNVETCEGRVVYVVPGGFRAGILSLSGCGRYMAFAYSEALNLSTGTGRIYSSMTEHLYRRPTSVIVYIDLARDEASAIWGEREWISHVNVSPLDPDVVLFCHEGPWHLVQRLWVVNAHTHEVSRPIETRRLYESAGHEFFLADGRLAAQYARRESLDEPWERSLAIVEPDGSDRTDCRWPSADGPAHVQASPDGDMFVADGAQGTDVPDPAGVISVFRCMDGQADVQPLCRHDTSWQVQHSHPHPFFSRDGRWIYYSSDAGGRANVYRVLAQWPLAEMAGGSSLAESSRLGPPEP